VGRARGRKRRIGEGRRDGVVGIIRDVQKVQFPGGARKKDGLGNQIGMNEMNGMKMDGIGIRIGQRHRQRLINRVGLQDGRGRTRTRSDVRETWDPGFPATLVWRWVFGGLVVGWAGRGGQREREREKEGRATATMDGMIVVMMDADDRWSSVVSGWWLVGETGKARQGKAR
jgi:hypothetical protein